MMEWNDCIGETGTCPECGDETEIVDAAGEELHGSCGCSFDQGRWSPDQDGEDEVDLDGSCPDCSGTGIGNPHVHTSVCSSCRGTGIRPAPDADAY